MKTNLAQLMSFLDTPTFTIPPAVAWLLTPWCSDIWEIQSRIGKKVQITRINWKAKMPDGSFLTDPQWADQLETVRRITYLVRSGPTAWTQNTGVQVVLARDLIRVLYFGVKSGLGSNQVPARYSSLQVSNFTTYCDQAVTGRWTLLDADKTIRECINDHREADELQSLLSEGNLNLEKLANATHIDVSTLRASPSLKELLAELGVPYQSNQAQTRAYPDHRSHKRPDNETVSVNTMASLLRAWQCLWDYREWCPDCLSFNPFEDSSPYTLAEALGRPKGRTPTIPVTVALFYMNAAIKWVVEYGNDLVDYYNASRVAIDDYRRGRCGSHHDYYASRAFNKVPQPASLRPLNISGFQGRHTNAPMARAGDPLSIVSAARMLIGACFMIIGIFSGRRLEEMLALQPDCVEGDEGAYLIRFYLEKGTRYGPVHMLSRPIPSIVQLAASLIGRLSADCVDKSTTIFNFDSPLGGLLQETTLKAHLDQFADYIDSPLLKDDKGRATRWYVRPHELRRFFAISFFWHSPNASLDALSWFLGHLDRAQTLIYIKESIGGEELTEEENRFTIEALRNRRGNVENRDGLENAITTHFKVDNLLIIPAEALEAYVDYLYETGALRIDVINSPSEYAVDAILIRYAEPCPA